MLPTVTVAWLTMELTGQWSLFLLLGTIAWSTSLPQRKNHFLVNLLLTTFLATIPPCLLLFAGYQDGVPPHALCLVQSVLMNGVAPMLCTALLVLVFHTWSELRAILRGKTSVTVKYSVVKYSLLLLPYVAMVSWCIPSTIAALQPSAILELSTFVYCASSDNKGSKLRENLEFFMITFGITETFFEVWIFCIFVRPVKLWRSKITSSASSSYNKNLQISIRIFIFSALQLTPIILALLNTNHHWNSVPLKQATQVLESMDAIATFFVFGTQKDILQVWKFWKPKTRPEHTSHEVRGGPETIDTMV